MSIRRALRGRARDRHVDGGFTLIELLIAVVLSSLIAGVTVAALGTSLNVASSTTDQVSDSTDAGLISSFLFRDAQSAGAIDPASALVDTTLGVSTTDWSLCLQAGSTLVVRFSWADHMSATVQNTVVATYALDGHEQLMRRVCKNGTPEAEVVLGRSVRTATATCAPVALCTGHPTSVSLVMSGSSARAPFAYTLTASLRGDVQQALGPTNSSPVSLLALGDPGHSAPCPNLTLGGSNTIKVIGDVLVDGSCGTSPITGNQALLQPTGTKSTIAGIADPFVGRQAPTYSCAVGGTNPSPIGNSPSSGATTVYPQAVSISTDVLFKPGRYVFCDGLSISSGRVTGTDVLLYIAAKTLAVGANATVDLTAFSTGTDANLLVWVASPQTITVAGGPRVSSWRGLVYAPSSTLQLSSSMAGNIGGIVVKNLIISGAGRARVGLPLPKLSLTPSTIPSGQVGVGYGATVVASGGTSPYTFGATGLPAGLGISASGTISGTPTASGSFPVVVTVFDGTAVAASIDYTMTVAQELTITSPTSLPNGQVGVVYPTNTAIATGGTAPMAWTSTGLPPGLSFPATGVLSGTPNTAGTFNLTIRVTDAMGASPTRSFTIVISAAATPLTVSGPATLPAGTKGSAYPSTIVTATGGKTPYVWSATAMPAGLTINSSTGAVTGTPTTAGIFSTVVKVTDALAATAQKTYTVTINACATPTVGWRGEYFANATLAGTAALCRDDANINFNWGSAAPATGLPVNNFSVRWTRTESFTAGNYKFSMGSDNGARLYVDGVLALDNWASHTYPATVPTVTKTLTAGNHTIVMEYYDGTGVARATLSWAPVPNGVTAVASKAGDHRFYGENIITLTNTSTITAMNVTITVVQTQGLIWNGQYTNYAGGDITLGHSTSGGVVTFTFDLKAGRTIAAGTGTIVAQTNGTGTLHPTTGDTWTVTTTSGGIARTLSGTF